MAGALAGICGTPTKNNSYSHDNPYGKQYLEKVITLLASGDAPDLINLAGHDYHSLMNRGFFLDLYTFIDNDPDLHREGFYQYILQAMETDGGLFRIAPFIEFPLVKIHRDYYDLLPEYIKGGEYISLDEIIVFTGIF